MFLLLWNVSINIEIRNWHDMNGTFEFLNLDCVISFFGKLACCRYLDSVEQPTWEGAGGQQTRC